ncbi:DNA adenine methylase [Haliangium sp.]|uniref:DNA adenine methylase n=1 Tax=Haliangium sp. TaxID=2663208 RepID=UPI003D0EA5FF
MKWAGGKGRLLSTLEAFLPRRFGHYFEPFLGGGAMFFRLAPERAVLADKNPDLMNLYRCVAEQVEPLLRRLARYRDQHCKEHYYEVRERWNQGRARQSRLERAAAFLYLNKTCYNGLYRVNQKGHFNVPMGRYQAPRIYDPAHLRAASALLRRANLTTSHFAEQVEAAEAGDFVYFDPPYDPLTKSANFTSYTSSCFGPEDQEELASLARRLTRRGVHVMLSNSDTPLIRRLYRGFDVHQIEAPRAINSKASARGAVHELVITNGYPM